MTGARKQAVTYLTAQAILGSDDLTREEVPVPEWGGVVLVRAATAGERDRFEMGAALAAKNKTEQDFRASLVVRCLIDEAGDRVFTDRQIAQVSGKNGAVVDKLFDVIRRLSGMTQEANADAVESFGASPDGGSSSD